jgi:hypothetical protein
MYIYIYNIVEDVLVEVMYEKKNVYIHNMYMYI